MKDARNAVIEELQPADGCEIVVYGARRIPVLEELELGREVSTCEVRCVCSELGRERRNEFEFSSLSRVARTMPAQLKRGVRKTSASGNETNEAYMYNLRHRAVIR